MKRVTNKDFIFAFDKNAKPVLTVNDGETVEFQTMDCFSDQIKTPADKIDGLDWDRINPATGPVFINGAEKGDSIKITIEKIDIASQAAMVTGEEFGVLGSRMKGLREKLIPIKDGKAIFNDDIQIPLNKMVGVIGVAPDGEPVNCGTPGSHGGNMDNKLIAEGAEIYFPVSVEGALFGLGDVHAAMGDGEIGVSGLEIAADVTVKINVVKDFNIRNPFLVNSETLVTIASSETIEDAIFDAACDMEEIVCPLLDIDTHEFAMLASAVCNVEICQVVDPLKTVRFTFPRWILKNDGF